MKCTTLLQSVHPPIPTASHTRKLNIYKYQTELKQRTNKINKAYSKYLKHLKKKKKKKLQSREKKRAGL